MFPWPPRAHAAHSGRRGATFTKQTSIGMFRMRSQLLEKQARYATFYTFFSFTIKNGVCSTGATWFSSCSLGPAFAARSPWGLAAEFTGACSPCVVTIFFLGGGGSGHGKLAPLTRRHSRNLHQSINQGSELSNAAMQPSFLRNILCDNFKNWTQEFTSPCTLGQPICNSKSPVLVINTKAQVTLSPPERMFQGSKWGCKTQSAIRARYLQRPETFPPVIDLLAAPTIVIVCCHCLLSAKDHIHKGVGVQWGCDARVQDCGTETIPTTFCKCVEVIWGFGCHHAEAVTDSCIAVLSPSIAAAPVYNMQAVHTCSRVQVVWTHPQADNL